MSDDVETEVSDPPLEVIVVEDTGQHARAAMVDSLTNMVDNIIVVSVDEEGNTNFAVDDYEIVIVPDDSIIGHGWSYNNGHFSPPVETPPEE